MYKLITYQLYLLQLENYELGRYFGLLLKKGFFPKAQQRKDLVRTMKSKVLIGCSVVTYLGIFLLFLYFALYTGVTVWTLFWLGLSIFFIPFYFLLYSFFVILLFPLEFVVKRSIIRKAKFKIQNLSFRIKIIAIAGSYGKTSMKHVLTELLKNNFKVASTPESVNTSLGVANWILKNVNDTTQILIVEMGEHYRGDVKALCEITPPNISIITGINEAHLERLKNLKNTAETIFEVIEFAKPNAIALLNGDDPNVAAHLKEFGCKDHTVLKYQKANIKNSKFHEKELCWSGFSEEAGEIKIPWVGEYALAYADAAIQVSKSFLISWEEVRKALMNTAPVKHRLEPIRSVGDLLIIDDAYNGNPQGAAEAIKVLSRFENRRKVYITPGLVEAGGSAKEVHVEIGRQLANVADVVVLIKNSVTPFIEEGLKGQGLNIKDKVPKVLWFETAQEAHAALGKILKSGDVVVFQNDWGDQYI